MNAQTTAPEPALRPAVRFEGVRFARGGRAVLDVPELRIATGAITVLFGPNGAGKTTMLRLIAGLERPDAGAIRVAGPRAGEGAVAYGFQEPVFLRRSVRANIELGLALRRVPARERGERVERAARACGIADLLDREARTLSGGEAQRANLARTLALRAPITLLDEPLAAFDRVGRAVFLGELARLLRAHAETVVLVTHDREEAFRLGDRIVVVLAGRVAAAGPTRAVLERPPDRKTAELLGHTVVPDGNGAALGIPPGRLRLGEGPETFRLVVEAVVEVGLERRLVGRIAAHGEEVAAELPLPAGEPAPAPGTVISVGAAGCVRVDGGVAADGG